MACRKLQDRNEVRMLFIILLLTACAELPKCPNVTAHEMQIGGKQWFILDAENLQALWTRSERLAKGECE